jgi:hypothetical protein
MSIFKSHRPLMLALMLAGLSGSAFAVDGTILIDQNRALAGNVTPGDTPGFPITISQPGSYRLSGNLRPPTDTRAIEIASNDVTFDLNGFAIIGDASGPFNNVRGISDVGTRTRIAIRNGSISGFNRLISLDSSSHVIIEQMNLNAVVSASTGASIVAGGVGGLVSRAIIRGNVSVGLISVTCPGLVSENVSTAYNFEITAGACTVFLNVTVP